MCETLGNSRSGCYKGRGGLVGARAQGDERLRDHMVPIHQESWGHYAGLRVHLALRMQGEPCGRKRVARLMREEALEEVRQGWRKVRRTDRNHSQGASPSPINAMAGATPNRVWIRDIKCYDNATMESFFGKFKTGEGAEFANVRSARLAVFEQIETYYNRSGIHASPADGSPKEFEDRHHSGETGAAKPTGSPEFSSGMGCASSGRQNGSEPEGQADTADSRDHEAHHPGCHSEGCSTAEPSSASPVREQQAPKSGLAQPK